VQDLSATTPDPGELLTQINRSLFSLQADGFDDVCDGVLPGGGCRAGRDPLCERGASDPLQVRRRAGLVERIAGKNGRAKGPALGLFGDGQYSTHAGKWSRAI